MLQCIIATTFLIVAFDNARNVFAGLYTSLIYVHEKKK